MLSVLANQTYRHLFAAQVIALIGTGMMTVALGLLAYKIAGDKAGAVLGTALAIKMIAYVGVAPVVGGFANFLPRRAFLVSMDITRAAVALALPFVDQVWQVYLLIFVLQSASAAFTPTFQATITRRASGRTGIHPRIVIVASRLRYGEPAQPDAGRGAAQSDSDRVPVMSRQQSPG
jgi:MFS family permease